MKIQLFWSTGSQAISLWKDELLSRHDNYKGKKKKKKKKRKVEKHTWEPSNQFVEVQG
jgi:hypothetical protein